MAAKKKVVKKVVSKKTTAKTRVRGKNKPKEKLLTKRPAKTNRAVALDDLVVITKGVRKNALGFVLDISGKQGVVGFGGDVTYEGAIRVSSLRHATKEEAGAVRHFATLLAAVKKAAFDAGQVKHDQIKVAMTVVESVEETKDVHDQITDAVTQVEDSLVAAEDEYNTLAI